MSLRLIFMIVVTSAAVCLTATTTMAQGRVLATPLGNAASPTQPDPGITYGGVLPAPEGILDPPIVDATATDDSSSQSAPEDEWDASAAADRAAAIADASQRFADAMGRLDDSARDKSDWAKRAEDVFDHAQDLAKQEFSTTDDENWQGIVTDLSLTARSLAQTIAGRLREGLSTSVFPSVRQAYEILQSEILAPLEPFERAAGVTPIDPIAQTAAISQTVPVAPAYREPFPPSMSFRPAIPVPAPSFGRPSFEFRLDIAPGLSTYGYQPFGLDRYDRYRYDSYRYDYRNHFDGYGINPYVPQFALPVFPSPATRYGFGIPAVPYGRGPVFGW